jgi:hypothetical protein
MEELKTPSQDERNEVKKERTISEARFLEMGGRYERDEVLVITAEAILERKGEMYKEIGIDKYPAFADLGGEGLSELVEIYKQQNNDELFANLRNLSKEMWLLEHFRAHNGYDTDVKDPMEELNSILFYINIEILKEKNGWNDREMDCEIAERLRR